MCEEGLTRMKDTRAWPHLQSKTRAVTALKMGIQQNYFRKWLLGSQPVLKQAEREDEGWCRLHRTTLL